MLLQSLIGLCRYSVFNGTESGSVTEGNSPMFNTFYLNRWLTYALLVCGLLSAQVSHGADIAHKIRQGSDALLSFELGFQLVGADLPVVGWVNDNAETPTGSVVNFGLFFDGRAEWKGLFAETNSHSFTSFALGYTPWSNNTTSVDFVISEGLGTYEPGIGAFESVEKRTSDLVAGIRTTLNLDSTLVQFEAYSDISGKHDGQMTALQMGKFVQIRNWNLHGLVGVRYFSGNMLDYYFGISESESTTAIPRYTASGGTLGSLEVGATLPLSGKWVLKLTAEGLYLPDSVTDSPLSNGRLGGFISTSVSHVF